jgi:fructuronate reductase
VSANNVRELNRALVRLPKAPVRIVHLGLGAFHRSHEAWYTQHASDGAEWGIAAFTGRRPDAALALAAQDGLFTLIERSGDGDAFEVIGSIAEAVDGADLGRLQELVAAPETVMVTLTITEAAYGLDSTGSFDARAAGFAGDLAVLGSAAGAGGTLTTPLGRLVSALAARRHAAAGPIAVVSCDNLSGNGEVARRAITGLAEAWDAGLAQWIKANVSFVSTSVDRITPRTTEADMAEVEESCGYRDSSPVVAEPFRDWVISGNFPKGRPRWEDAGAVVVDDIEPYENRKLWLLNGAHSLLAYAGQLRGHTTVAQALEGSVLQECCGGLLGRSRGTPARTGPAHPRIPGSTPRPFCQQTDRSQFVPDRRGWFHEAPDEGRAGPRSRKVTGPVWCRQFPDACRMDRLRG